jgi:hypothetical protein
MLVPKEMSVVPPKSAGVNVVSRYAIPAFRVAPALQVNRRRVAVAPGVGKVREIAQPSHSPSPSRPPTTSATRASGMLPVKTSGSTSPVWSPRMMRMPPSVVDANSIGTGSARVKACAMPSCEKPNITPLALATKVRPSGLSLMMSSLLPA